MYILIDNSVSWQLVVYYTLNNKWVQKVFSNKNKRMELLNALEKIFKKTNSSPEDLFGMAVLIGKGSFTATRLAVTVVNTLAYALKIPVVGITEINLADLQTKIKSQKVGVYISAVYSGEANIGQSKK